MIYSIEVGRWSGAFFPVCYADVFSSEDHHRLATFNAFTKAGACKKAARFIRRAHKSKAGFPRDVTVYSYDAALDEVKQLSSDSTEPTPASV